jgi:hypothetical protein
MRTGAEQGLLLILGNGDVQNSLRGGRHVQGTIISGGPAGAAHFEQVSPYSNSPVADPTVSTTAVLAVRLKVFFPDWNGDLTNVNFASVSIAASMTLLPAFPILFLFADGLQPDWHMK